mmetsp:Transcript_1422/g.3330  ORF Transcript_1422/g.3330 Transcript_1422/m.3330 type:complete len:292 (-) Transcript_1422:170-1045(-)
MSSAAYIVEAYVCPTIGAILSTLTFAAPIKALRSSIKNGSLGDLNPTPWIFMLGNTIGWLAYSFVTDNLFVFFANAPGLLISIFLNVGAMKLQYYEMVSSIQLTESRTATNQGDDADDTQNTMDASELDGDIIHNNTDEKQRMGPPSLTSHEKAVLCIIITWFLILSITSLAPISKRDTKLVIGIAVNLNLIFFYGAPLSTIVTVVRTRNSASIHFLTMVMNTFNAFFWCVYSSAIGDYNILIPNGLGFLFGAVQIALYSIFPRGEVVSEADGAEFLNDGGNAAEAESEII